MEWVKQFYSKQHEWAGVFDGDVEETHRQNAASVQRLSGGWVGRVLELGAGGGQNAAALADLGYSVVAVEIVQAAVRNARMLASHPRNGPLCVVEGDFYAVEFKEPFDIVCYWDGFGIGSDEDQQRLLQRIARWLRPTGLFLVEVYTPWYWAGAAGRHKEFGDVIRRYDFDTAGSRMLDSWWPVGCEGLAVTQSLRCYAPEELQMLVKGTGLALRTVESRGAFDWEKDQFVEHAPLDQAMQYLAILVPESHQ